MSKRKESEQPTYSHSDEVEYAVWKPTEFQVGALNNGKLRPRTIKKVTESMLNQVIEHTLEDQVMVPPPETFQEPEPVDPLTLIPTDIIESAKQKGFDEGFVQGHTDGYQSGVEQGHAEGFANAKAEVARLQSLVEQASTLFTEFEEMIAPQVLELAVAISKKILRREIHTDSSLILRVIEEAFQELLGSESNKKLLLHPSDIATVQRELGESLKLSAWELFPDESITPGGCKILSKETEIDATLERYWKRLMIGLSIPEEKASVDLKEPELLDALATEEPSDSANASMHALEELTPESSQSEEVAAEPLPVDITESDLPDAHDTESLTDVPGTENYPFAAESSTYTSSLPASAPSDEDETTEAGSHSPAIPSESGNEQVFSPSMESENAGPPPARNTDDMHAYTSDYAMNAGASSFPPVESHQSFPHDGQSYESSNSSPYSAHSSYDHQAYGSPFPELETSLPDTKLQMSEPSGDMNFTSTESIKSSAFNHFDTSSIEDSSNYSNYPLPEEDSSSVSLNDMSEVDASSAQTLIASGLEAAFATALEMNGASPSQSQDEAEPTSHADESTQGS